MKATLQVGRHTYLRGALGGVAGVMLGAVMSSCSDATPARMVDDPTQAPAQPTRAPAQPTQTPAQPNASARPTHASAGPTHASACPAHLDRQQGLVGLLLAGWRELLLRRTNSPRGWEHRSAGGHDQPAHRVRRPPHRTRRSLSRRLRGDRRAERPGTERRCPSGHREPAGLDRALRHRAAGQPDLERQSAHDHVDLRRGLRLHRQDRLPVHDARG